ncbi:MAG: CoA ester lyase [Paracoccaceae bacterium]
MPASARPRRSVLYMPGSRARALEKARALPADALILDLEDAVTPDEKTAARALVEEAVLAGGYGAREVIVRVNGLDTAWGAADIAAAAAAGPDAILIPKVESPAMIHAVAALIAAAPDRTAIWAMMETPRGFLSAASIAAAHPRLAALVMGTNDLVKELRAEHVPGRAPVAAALGLAMLAARAEGLACLDGVCNAFRDADLLRAECEAGRAMGFDGKTLIHPGQIAIANEVFGPSEAALEEAQAHLAAYEAAAAKGGGVAVVNGRIVENLHVEAAKRMIAEAEAISRLEDAAD